MRFISFTAMSNQRLDKKVNEFLMQNSNYRDYSVSSLQQVLEVYMQQLFINNVRVI